MILESRSDKVSAIASNISMPNIDHRSFDTVVVFHFLYIQMFFFLVGHKQSNERMIMWILLECVFYFSFHSPFNSNFFFD